MSLSMIRQIGVVGMITNDILWGLTDNLSFKDTLSSRSNQSPLNILLLECTIFRTSRPFSSGLVCTVLWVLFQSLFKAYWSRHLMPEITFKKYLFEEWNLYKKMFLKDNLLLQIWTWDSRTCTIFILSLDSIWGVFRVFPAIKIVVICQVHMYCGLSVKTNTHEPSTVCKGHGCSLFEYVSTCVIGKKTPNTPNWSSMADDAITLGSRVLGSPFYICVSSNLVMTLTVTDIWCFTWSVVALL